MEEEDIFSDEFDDLQNHGIFQLAHRPRLDSRMSVCLPSKGLLNAPGENNCFLNACVQLLWHLNVFRRSFRLLEGHSCSENACIFCALKQLFHQFEESNASCLAPNALREAMANSFMLLGRKANTRNHAARTYMVKLRLVQNLISDTDHRFQLGRMDDAAECLENILQRLHNHIANGEVEETCSAQHCIPHQKFALNIMEQVTCRCKATGEPKSYYQFVHYVTASSIACSSSMQSTGGVPFSLGKKLKILSQSSEVRTCPDEKRCNAKDNRQTQVQSTLLNAPDVVSLGIIWDTDRPSSKYILDVVSNFTENLYLADMFDNVLDETCKALELKLAGVVTYYGKHYTSFFYNVREQQWTYFDDAHVAMIGSKWESVKEKCYMNCFQPLLFVYSNGGGLPVDASNALKIVRLVSQERLLMKPPVHRKVKRRHSHRHRHHKKSRARPPAEDLLKPFSSQSLPQPRSLQSTPEKTFKSPRPRKKKNNLSLDSSKLKSSTLPNFDSLNHQDEMEHQKNIRNATRNSVPSVRNSKTENIDMNNSCSDDNINNDSFDSNDSLEQRRVGYVKKKLGNVMKNINPLSNKPKSKHNKNRNDSETNELMQASLNEINFADVGFNSPHLNSQSKFSHNRTVPSNDLSKKDLANQCKEARLSNNHQLDNLNRHVENINSCLSRVGINEPKSNDESISNCVSSKNGLNGQQKNESGNKTHSDLNNGFDTIYNSNKVPQCDDISDRSLKGNPKPLSTNNTNQNDLIYFNSRPEVITESVVFQPTANEFESLIDQADAIMLECEYHEQMGDLLLALRLSTDATALYRDASKTENLNEDLFEFVDQRRQESFARSKYLQKHVGSIVDDKTDYTVEKRNAFSTSDYGSMSDAPSYETNTPHWSSQQTSRVHDLLELQRHNAKQMALNRILKDEFETRRDNGQFNVLSDPNKSYHGNGVTNNIYNIKTDIRWVVDKPNNNDHLSTSNSSLNNPDLFIDKNSNISSQLNRDNVTLETSTSRKSDCPEDDSSVCEKRYSPETIYGDFPINGYKQSIDKHPDLVNDAVNLNLKTKHLHRLRCSQCGYREVSMSGQCCQFCQSEYL